MDIEPRREGAVIYRFPPGGRAALQRKNETRPDPIVTIPSGRGWYHDAAIRDAEGARDPKPRG